MSKNQLEEQQNSHQEALKVVSGLKGNLSASHVYEAEAWHNRAGTKKTDPRDILAMRERRCTIRKLHEPKTQLEEQQNDHQEALNVMSGLKGN